MALLLHANRIVQLVCLALRNHLPDMDSFSLSLEGINNSQSIKSGEQINAMPFH